MWYGVFGDCAFVFGACFFGIGEEVDGRGVLGGGRLVAGVRDKACAAVFCGRGLDGCAFFVGRF